MNTHRRPSPAAAGEGGRRPGEGLLLLVLLALTSCTTAPPPRDLNAGFRWSVYGPKFTPPAEYWGMVGLDMSRRFEGSAPSAIWIVSRKNGTGTQLNFPVTAKDPLITGQEHYDNEAVLQLFDRLGFRVWLQIEPFFADVDEQLHLLLSRYKHHPSVIGVGIDVEWYRSNTPDEGQAVTDAEATRWLNIARSYNPSYRLFLKHWEIEKMPPTVRHGLLFVDDSQILPSMQAMIDEFAQWGRAFAPAPVAFQYGYPSDRPWWISLKDPPNDIGEAILKRVPNAEGLYWVDFTVSEIWPPAQKP